VRKPQLLAAAAEVIRDKGFYQARLEDIGQRVGLSASQVLYHFDSRDAILEEALDYNEDAFYRQAVPQLARAERPSDQFICVAKLAGTWDFTLWIETWARSLRTTTARRATERQFRRFDELVEAIVRAGQELGEFTTDVEVTDFVQGWCAMMNGLCTTSTLGLPGTSAERTVELLISSASTSLGCDMLSRWRKG
jgi:AcrR family transcriptional regulator